MVLMFDKEIDGKPTYFAEKIHRCYLCDLYSNENMIEYKRIGYPLNYKPLIPPKRHTIREDKANRWRMGKTIKFRQWERKGYRSKQITIAPDARCCSVQKIEIRFHRSSKQLLTVRVDERYLLLNEIRQLAINDGFNSVKDFAAYFKTNFKGKIIHWTDLKY